MPRYVCFVLLAFCLSSAAARAEPICVAVLNDGSEDVTLCMSQYPFGTSCHDFGANRVTVVICAPA